MELDAEPTIERRTAASLSIITLIEMDKNTFKGRFSTTLVQLRLSRMDFQTSFHIDKKNFLRDVLSLVERRQRPFFE